MNRVGVFVDVCVFSIFFCLVEGRAALFYILCLRKCASKKVCVRDSVCEGG